MNQQCKVCGEPAAGFHFGAFTCEGCKSFFGRTYNNLGSISECKNGGVCVINKKNRTACKACRLRKCLMVGMSKSGSRYGRRSNWFKIHCLLQEQTNSAGSGTGLQPSHFSASFLPNFLPGLQPTSVPQGLMSNFQPQVPNSAHPPTAKEPREDTSPSHEDLALQSHLLHVAMMKHKSRERSAQAQVAALALAGAKSPRPSVPMEDQVGLQSQLKLLGWHAGEACEERSPLPPSQQAQQQSHQQGPIAAGTTPSHNSSPSSASPTPPLTFAQSQVPPPGASSIFHAVNLAAAAAAAASGSLEVFRPFLPASVYKRTSDSPSDSGASSQESDGLDDESAATRAFLRQHQQHQSLHHQHHHHQHQHYQHHLQQQHQPPHEEPPRRKLNATLTLTADYLPQQQTRHQLARQQLLYPATELVTPAASHHSLLRGGDLLLASPSPGGLAVEQLEPIDLSLRSAARPLHLTRRRRRRRSSGASSSCSPGRSSSSRSSCSPKRQQLQHDSRDCASPGISAAKGNPLDLSLDNGPVKRPARAATEVSL